MLFSKTALSVVTLFPLFFSVCKIFVIIGALENQALFSEKCSRAFFGFILYQQFQFDRECELKFYSSFVHQSILVSDEYPRWEQF